MLLRTTAPAWPCWLLLSVTPLACGGDGAVPDIDGLIDRETFIEVYVDLRAASVEGRDLAISDEERDAILARHGVDEAGLLAFVDAYGRELDFMNELWAEVESRIEAMPPLERDARAPGA